MGARRGVACGHEKLSRWSFWIPGEPQTRPLAGRSSAVRFGCLDLLNQFEILGQIQVQTQ